VDGRVDVLARALRQMPEEETAFRYALELQGSLRDSPAPPLAEVLPALIRLSARIAELICAEVAAAGVTEVRLAGADPDELIGGSRTAGVLPLADWRAL